MSKQSYRFGAREAFVLVVALLSALVAIGYQTRDAYATGTFSLSSNTYSVNEGDAVTIVVNKSGTHATDINIQLTVTPDSAIAGTDYVDPGFVLLTF